MPESYQELLKDIAPLDTPVQTTQAKTIDISATLTGKSVAKGENYWSLLETVGEIESVGHGKVDYIARERAARQQALKHVTLGPGGESAPTSVGAPKSDLGALASGITSSIPILKNFNVQRVNTKELVLPNLSLADQIAELERIIEGLTENVFDKDHMDIVVLEVYGLRDAVKGFKKNIKRKPLSTLEQSLWSIRDQRISDAIALLENINNQSKVNA